MLPGGMDPKKMETMMRQMGIRQEKLDARRVTIETETGNLVIDDPEVMKITMQGHASFQITGTIRSESSSDDIKLVIEQANCSEEDAKSALDKCGGDIAQAIVFLSEEKSK